MFFCFNIGIMENTKELVERPPMESKLQDCVQWKYKKNMPTESVRKISKTHRCF